VADPRIPPRDLRAGALTLAVGVDAELRVTML
jgi:hypothetical protein